MLRGRIAAIVCCLAVGCSSNDGQIVSSVRSSLKEQFASQDKGKKQETSSVQSTGTGSGKADAGGGKIQPVSGTDTDVLDGPVGELAESIVARVNADVILAQDLFGPIRPQLLKAQQELPAAEFTRYRSSLIQKQLRDLIERQLLIQEAKKQIPEQGVSRLEAMADKEFGKRIESEMKRMGVNTEAELRRKMLENGESLDQLKEFQRGTFIAQQFLRMQLGPRLDVSREEMVDNYNLHRERYKKEGGVRWSEILLSSKRHGSHAAALARAEQILDQLRRGASFAELAKLESDGATASQGGSWELTTRGSYRVSSVDEAIFSLPAGQFSEPIEGPEGWHVVRVDEVVPSGETGFVNAQDEIRKEIREEKIRNESQKYVQDLIRKAHISTVFDRPGSG